MMKIKIFSILLLSALTGVLFPLKAQVNIGSAKSPERYSILELTTSSKSGGLRLPQLTTAQRNALLLDTIQSAANKEKAYGLTIFNTDTDVLEYWDGHQWSKSSDNQWVNKLNSSSVVLEKSSNGGLRFPSEQVAVNDNGSMVIGSDTILNKSAMLEINATNKGFLLPRLTTAERDLISSPVAGLTIFNTETNCPEVYINATRGWYNSCIPSYSNQTPASFDFDCQLDANGNSKDIKFFPPDKKVPAGAFITKDNGYAAILTYTGGNGGSYDKQTFYSQDPFGLIGTLDAGQLNGSTTSPGTGDIFIPITGKVSSIPADGNAKLAVTIAGRICIVNIPLGNGKIDSIDKPAVGTVYAGINISSINNLKQDVVFNYDGGDGGVYPSITVPSTGVTGMTLSIQSGTFKEGKGTLTFKLNGEPTKLGKATFTGSIGGQTFTAEVTVTAFRSCKEIYDYDSTTPSGVYKIDPDLGDGPFPLMNAQCDMKTEIEDPKTGKIIKGGWTLVYNYVHMGRRGNEKARETLPIFAEGNDLEDPLKDLGKDESTNPDSWGNVSSDLVKAINPTGFRMYGTSERTDIVPAKPVVHFYSEGLVVMSYFKGGKDIPRETIWPNVKATYLLFKDHKANLPATINDSYTTTNKGRVLNYFPFFQNGVRHISVADGRFDVDDWNNGQYDTIHRMWVR